MKSLFNKYSTGISGFDALFFGGLRLDTLDVEKPDGGLIIMLRGAKGVHKTLLAMQLMQGLGRNILRNCEGRLFSKSMFFSMNKKRDSLQDMYLDLLVSMQASRIIRDAVSGKKDIWQSNVWVKSLFDISGGVCLQADSAGVVKLPDDCILHADKYVAERSMYYNPRTNSLHFRRGCVRDDDGNLLFHRKYNDLEGYCAHGREALVALPAGFKQDFFEVGFNRHEEGNGGFTYEGTTLDGFSKVLEYIEHSENGMKSPCCVLDGFSSLRTRDLERLPFAHLEKVLRRTSVVSVVVLDERGENANFNADIVIEMRQSTTGQESYNYHELRVAKSVFHSSALGWHQYKKRDDGLAVFPSLHLLLQRRYYLAHILTTTHSESMRDSYGDYLLAFPRNQYADYEKDMIFKSRTALREIAEAKMNRMCVADVPDKPAKDAIALLEQVLLGKKGRMGGTTSFVGNPNSYKRFLMLGAVYAAARRKEHTLFVLFDKDMDMMRRSTACPVHIGEKDYRELVSCLSKNENAKQNCSVCNALNCKLIECEACGKYVHYFPLRMGGLFADEFLSILNEQVEVPFPDGKTVSRIVIDDLQKIDYSFPFLKRESLFLSALINLCREKKIELCILCDKKASLAKELCSLADNVVCTRRGMADRDKVSVYLEKVMGHVGTHPCEIFQYDLRNASRLFVCGKEGLELDSSCIAAKEIGSMKEFWRAKYDINPDGTDYGGWAEEIKACRAAYEESLKDYRDMYSLVSTAEKKGWKEGLQAGKEKGREEGKAEGQREERIKTARNLKRLGVATEVISRATGLSPEEMGGL